MPDMTTTPKTRLTYEEAAEQCVLRYSARSLRRFASFKTPARKRLRVVRLNRSNVQVRIHDLREWEARMEGRI